MRKKKEEITLFFFSHSCSNIHEKDIKLKIYFSSKGSTSTRKGLPQNIFKKLGFFHYAQGFSCQLPKSRFRDCLPNKHVISSLSHWNFCSISLIFFDIDMQQYRIIISAFVVSIGNPKLLCYLALDLIRCMHSSQAYWILTRKNKYSNKNFQDLDLQVQMYLPKFECSQIDSC